MGEGKRIASAMSLAIFPTLFVPPGAAQLVIESVPTRGVIGPTLGKVGGGGGGVGGGYTGVDDVTR